MNKYDISQYTDQELYQILDLHQPTDRELEAKILQLLNQYDDDSELYQFTYEIYQHFFEIDPPSDDNVQEGFANANTTPPAANATPYLNIADPATAQGTPSPYIFSQEGQAPSNEPEQQEITYQTNITYTKGNVNPLLKETIQRVISIDSRERDTVTYPYSTDFTINLNETLNNVVSMKLYSVQIPYTWYTIDSTYGSNIFFLKGNQPAISSSNFDLQVTIPSGNYQTTDIIRAIRTGFQTVFAANPDINFGQTDISYNNINGFCNMTLDLQNIYHENAYYIEFPDITLPTMLQYIYYTTDSAPYITMTNFNINISPYILQDFLDPQKAYTTLSELVADLSQNLQTKVKTPTLRNIASTIFDSSYNNIEALFRLDPSQNQVVSDLGQFNLDQLLFLTDMCDNQLSLFFGLSTQEKTTLNATYITPAEFIREAQKDLRNLSILYQWTQQHIAQSQYTDLSNIDAGTPTTLPPRPAVAGNPSLQHIATTPAYYITGGIVPLYQHYNNTQLNLLEQYHHDELLPLSTIPDTSLSILAQIPYPYTHVYNLFTDISNQSVTYPPLLTAADISATVLQQFSQFPTNVWEHIYDLSNISIYWRDISGITHTQYDFLTALSDASLSILAQIRIPAAQYQALHQLSIDSLDRFTPNDTTRLSEVYNLTQTEINTLYQYTSEKTNATLAQNTFLTQRGVTQDIVNQLSTGNPAQDISVNQLGLLMQYASTTATTPNTARVQDYVAIAQDISGFITYGIVEFQQLQPLRHAQITLLDQLTPVQSALLAQHTPAQIANLAQLTTVQLANLAQLNREQIYTVTQLSSAQQTIFNHLSPTPLSWIWDLSSAQIADLSRNVLSNVIYQIPTITLDDFMVNYTQIARQRLSQTQHQFIQHLFQEINDELAPQWTQLLSTTSETNQTLQSQYQTMMAIVTTTPTATPYFANFNDRISDILRDTPTLAELIQSTDTYYLDTLTPTQQLNFQHFFYGSTPFAPLPLVPPILPDQIADFSKQITGQIIHTYLQEMAYWDVSAAAEWSILAKLSLSNVQLGQLAEINSSEMTQITNILQSGKQILDSISGFSNDHQQVNIIKLIRYSEYRTLFNDPAINSTNLISFNTDPSSNIDIYLPAPPSVVVNDATSNTDIHSGYYIDEWIQLIQRQFQATPTFRDTTFTYTVTDISHQELNINIQTDKKAPGYYLMSFYDPQNYPDNLRQSSTLVWDASGQQNLWYKYLKIPHASEVLLSNRYFTPLPNTNYQLFQPSRQYDLCGNFNLPPDVVPISIENSYINYTIPELLGLEQNVYELYTYTSNTFFGNAYNYDAQFPQFTPDVQHPAFHLEFYLPEIRPANPNYPIGHTNYTYTDICSSLLPDTSLPPDSPNHIYRSINYTLTTSISAILSTSNEQKISLQNLLKSINESITNSNLFTSDSRLWIKDANTHTDVSNIELLNDIGTYYYEFTLKCHRQTLHASIKNQPNLKYAIQFRDPLWTNARAFDFPFVQHEFSTIISEHNPVKNDIFYTAPIQIQFRCIAPGFQYPLNDISLAVASPGDHGYNYTTFLNNINVALSSPTLKDFGITGNIKTVTTNNYADFSFNIQHIIPNIGADPNATPNADPNAPSPPYPNFIVDFSNSIFATFTETPNPWTFTSDTTNYDISSINVPGVFHINAANQNIIVTCQGAQQSTTVVFPIPLSNPYRTQNGNSSSVYTISELINTINTQVFSNQVNNHVSLYGSFVHYNATTQIIHLTLSIQSILTNQDYAVHFIDPNNQDWQSNTWQTTLGIVDSSYTLGIDSSYNSLVNIRGNIRAQDRSIYLTDQNNYFTIKPAYDAVGGVYINSNTSATGISNISADNDIVIKLSSLSTSTYYTISDILNEINWRLSTYHNQYGNIAYGSSFILDASTNRTMIRVNINQIYTTKDYLLDFFDPKSYMKCSYGTNAGTQVAKWDTTLGWILGFHGQSIYELTPENQTTPTTFTGAGIIGSSYYKDVINNPYTYDISTNVATIRGDIPINVNLHNYLLLVLDDHTQSHINDGLVTITKASSDLPINSYAVRHTALSCPEAQATTQTNIFVQNQQDSQLSRNNKTQKQLYSMNEIYSTRMSQLQNPFQMIHGPNIQDIFGIIPLKTTGLQTGQSYTEFGGTLQNQDRNFFGPVNIRRFTIRLVTENGSILNLNNSDWSFSIIAQQLYTSTSSQKK